MTTRRFEDLRKTIEEKKSLKIKYETQLLQLLDSLKEYGVSSLDEAEKLLEKMESELEILKNKQSKLENRLEELLNES